MEDSTGDFQKKNFTIQNIYLPIFTIEIRHYTMEKGNTPNSRKKIKEMQHNELKRELSCLSQKRDDLQKCSFTAVYGHNPCGSPSPAASKGWAQNVPFGRDPPPDTSPPPVERSYPRSTWDVGLKA